MKHIVFVDHSGSVVYYGNLLEAMVAKARTLAPESDIYAFSHFVAPLQNANSVAGGGTLMTCIEHTLRSMPIYPDKVTVLLDEWPCWMHAGNVLHPDRWTFINFGQDGSIIRTFGFDEAQ